MSKKKSTMVPACTLKMGDKIEVPVHTVMIKSIKPVPGQFKGRKVELLEAVFVPVAGPWEGTESKLTFVESADLFPLIEAYKPNRFKHAIKTILHYLNPWAEGRHKPLPNPVLSITGPQT